MYRSQQYSSAGAGNFDGVFDPSTSSFHSLKNLFPQCALSSDSQLHFEHDDPPFGTRIPDELPDFDEPHGRK